MGDYNINIQKCDTSNDTLDFRETMYVSSFYAILTARKVPIFGVFFGPHSVRMKENTDQKTPNTDTFYAAYPYQLE